MSEAQPSVRKDGYDPNSRFWLLDGTRLEYQTTLSVKARAADVTTTGGAKISYSFVLSEALEKSIRMKTTTTILEDTSGRHPLGTSEATEKHLSISDLEQAFADKDLFINGLPKFLPEFPVEAIQTVRFPSPSSLNKIPPVGDRTYTTQQTGAEDLGRGSQSITVSLNERFALPGIGELATAKIATVLDATHTEVMLCVLTNQATSVSGTVHADLVYLVDMKSGLIVQVRYDFRVVMTSSCKEYDNERSATLTYSLINWNINLGKLVLTASSDKSLYITREKLVIRGDLTFAGKPVGGASIKVKVIREDGSVDALPSALTAADGSFVVNYEVPKIAPKTTGPERQRWVIEVVAAPKEQNYGEASVKITVEVVPIRVELRLVQLVQVVQVPLLEDGAQYVAAQREAGIRALIAIPSLQGIQGATKPEVAVKLEIWSRDTLSDTPDKEETKSVVAGSDPTPVDFIFTLATGRYRISVRADPEFKFMSKDDADQLVRSLIVAAKEMKTLKIAFIPTYLDVKSRNSLANFLDFARKQAEFIKKVYPLPAQNFNFVVSTKAIEPKLLAPTFGLQRWLLMKTLSLHSYLIADKLVGVLPDDAGWWEPGVSGVSGWSLFPVAYYTRSVLVRNGSNEGTTAHEIGHTLGLYRFPATLEEQYVRYPPFGKEVNELILKNGHIYDTAIEKERFQAFGNGTPKVYCFMGRNSGGLTPDWSCNDIYSGLFNSLKDPSGKVVYVSGTIYRNGTVHSDNWYLMEGQPDPGDEGTYVIQAVSSDKKVLYRTGFGSDDGEFLPFGFVIPYPDGTSSILIKKGDQVLREFKKSPSNPTVTVVAPKAGELIDGNLEIRWTATDADGDKLAFSVLYSNDGGESWRALAVELNQTSFSVDSTWLPGGRRTIVKVVATDGFNTGQGVSEGLFTVADKPPILRIDSPVDGSIYKVGERVVLKGWAFDIEDWELDPSNLAWSSSIDGPIGSGREITVANLSAGNHIITLKSTDSAKKTGEAAISLSVGKTTPPEPPIPSVPYGIIAAVVVMIIVAIVALYIRRGGKRPLYR